MGPLFLVNWRAIHRRFCLLIWLVAAALAMAIIVHLGDAPQACARSAATCAVHLTHR